MAYDEMLVVKLTKETEIAGIIRAIGEIVTSTSKPNQKDTIIDTIDISEDNNASTTN